MVNITKKSFLFSVVLVLLLLVTVAVGTVKISEAHSELGGANGAKSNRYNGGFSETQLEYCVNKPSDPSMNETVIDPNPGRSPSYAERDQLDKMPDLNGTEADILYTNDSIISFSPPDNANSSEMH